MTTEIERIVKNFMWEKYSIKPSQDSMVTLRRCGFSSILDKKKQIEDLEKLQRRIGPEKSEYILVAKVFSLAYKFKAILKRESDEKIAEWSSWLGSAEYKLAILKEKPEIKKKLFEKSLEHLLISEEKGNDKIENTYRIGRCLYHLSDYAYALASFLEVEKRDDKMKENISMIGSCFFHLGRYRKTLEYSLKARKLNDKSKENTGMIGSSYFMLGKFEKGFSEYEETIKLAKQEKKEKFSDNWMRAFDCSLKDSFDMLVESKGSIKVSIYVGYLKRFQEIYKDFFEYWKENQDSSRIYLQLGFPEENNLIKQEINKPLR